MSIQPPVLLLYSDPEPALKLEALLENLSVPTVRASSCQEARTLLGRPGTPRIVFADTTLRDGMWRDALRLAGETSPSRAVIVVNRWDDVHLYLAALEEGAFDFVAPPFLASDVSWVLRSAQLHLEERTRSWVKAAAMAA
jgi:DNA-binding NtrC family response regulator